MSNYLKGCDVLGKRLEIYDTIIGASGYRSFENTQTYEQGDLALYFGKFYKAVRKVTPPFIPAFMSGEVPGISDAWAEIPSIAVGSISDTSTDYDYGEKNVISLIQFFNALGRPLDFEADVERVYAAYEKAKVWEIGGPAKLSRWMNATAMKQVGADAAVVMDKLREAGAHRGAAGTAAGTSASKLIPTTISNPVYEPKVDKPSDWSFPSLPTWVWGGVAVAAGGTALWLLAPLVAPLLLHRLARGRK